MNPKNVVKYRNLQELKLLDNNPRTITKEKMDKLINSIRDNADYFEARPIICSDRTGELVILAGNQRYRAAKSLGLKEVPTIVLSGLSEEKEREIIIRDNVELGSWDIDSLANSWEINELNDWGVELVSYNENDLDDFFKNDIGNNNENKNKAKTVKCPGCGMEFEI